MKVNDERTHLQTATEPEGSGPADVAAAKRPSLNAWHTSGNNIFCQPGYDPTIIFTSASGDVTRRIVNETGRILNFPGISPEVETQIEGKASIRCSLSPEIRYCAEFNLRPNGTILMIWEVQPDGRYWEDGGGFGSTSDQEIRLYSIIDGQGRYTGPFRLYNIGVKDYYTESDLRRGEGPL